MVVSIQAYGDLANRQAHLHALVMAVVFGRQVKFTALAVPPAGVAGLRRTQTPVERLALLCQHISPPGFHLTRLYGAYVNRRRVAPAG